MSTGKNGYWRHQVDNTQKFLHRCPQRHMAQWITALVRSRDIPKMCEFNTRWKQWRTFRWEQQEVTDNWPQLNMARGTRTVNPDKRN